MNDKYIFKSINTNKEKKSFKEFLRHQTNSEYGGYKIYDGSRNHLLQIPEELSELVFFLNKFQKKKSNFKSFLEIGFASGKTNTIFNRFFKFNQIVAVDNFACDINANDLFANVQRKKLILLCGSSSSKEIKNNLKKFSPFDLILIDGSHEYKDVINDINISTNLINNNVDKYKKGKLLIIAGSKGYSGACILASMASIRSGAGIVKIIAPRVK